MTIRSALVVTLLLVSTFWVSGQSRAPSIATRPGEWRFHGGDPGSTQYSPLDQINKDNFKKLQVAWRWNPNVNPDVGPEVGVGQDGSESQPLMINGVLYIPAGTRRFVAAVDAATGRTLWTWANTVDRGARAEEAPRKMSGRGVGYWTDGKEERIFTVTPGFYLVALDARSGIPVASFGTNGVVDLMKELNLPGDHTGKIGSSSPPMIYKDTVIVPPSLEEGYNPISMRNTPGYVMAFDARTGRQKWAFHTVPKTGEFGAETWENGSNTYTGNTGVWGLISVDPELGYAYLPVETPTGDYYGGHRHGDNLFGNSLVCVDIETGKRVWHYQLTHHDIWNYDPGVAPTLMDVTVDGRRVKALVQITKQAFAYVLDRVTGRPVWPIEERPVPPSDVLGEKASRTQPHPTKPPAYDRQGYVEDDLIDYTPALRAEALALVKPYRLGPLFTPPSTQGSWYNPGGTGGSVWESGAFDPETGYFYVGSKTGASIITVGAGLPAYGKKEKSDMRFGRKSSTQITVQGLPILKPPYSRITAIDMNKGAFAWVVPHGDTPASIKNHPALKGLTLPKTGALARRGAMLVTKTLLVAAEIPGGAPILRAYDKTTGALLGEASIPGSVGSLPMTYMLNGKQYIAFAIVGQKQGAELVALALGN